MGIQVGWDDEAHTILLYTMDGRWRWNDLYEAVKEGHALNNDTSHDVYAVVNLERGLGVPPSAMTQFGKLATLTRPNTRVVVFVGGGGFVSALIKTFNRIYHGTDVQTCWVATLGDAYALVNREKVRPIRDEHAS